MPTREQVLRLLESGLGYEAAGRRLGVPAGQAYLIATGRAADGSDTLTEAEQRRPGLLGTSSQHLASPGEVVNPTTQESVRRWLRQRTAADAPMREAARRRTIEHARPAPLESEADVTAVLTREHDRLTALWKQLAAIPAPGAGATDEEVRHRVVLVRAIDAESGPHFAAEEAHLWPAATTALPDGGDLAEQARRQQREAADTVARLLAGLEAAPQSADNEPLVARLGRDLNRHAALLDAAFARLRAALPGDERDRLGREMRAAHQTEDR